MENIGEEIESAVANALAECRKGLTISPKGRKMARSQGAVNAASLDAAETVAKVLTAHQPILISVISVAVKASSEAMMEEIKKLHAGTSLASPSHDNQARMETKFSVDQLEQYSRRENLRVVGIPTSEGEDTDHIVINLGRDLGVEVKKRRYKHIPQSEIQRQKKR